MATALAIYSGIAGVVAMPVAWLLFVSSAPDDGSPAMNVRAGCVAVAIVVGAIWPLVFLVGVFCFFPGAPLQMVRRVGR